MTQDQIRQRLIKKMNKRKLSRKDVQGITGVNHVTVWRFLNGKQCKGDTLDLLQKV